MTAPGVWAITSYFNPIGYRRRLANYRAFRARLSVPLLTVELGGPELTDADAEIILRVPHGAVVWQKERLLNLALRNLPDDCAAVAWIDADVIFGHADWPALAMAALDRCPVVHLFESLHHVHPAWRTDGGMPRAEDALMHQHSMVALIAREGDAPARLAGATARSPGAASVGVAWAARRDLLEDSGFYDGCIIGGGDTALACAAYGCTDVVERLHSMNAAMASRYRVWAERFHERVRGKVGWIPGDLFHLWHGDLADRRARARHEGLAPFAFDPTRDVAVNPHGAWDWATDKPEMHAYVRDYFASRNEDGARPRSVLGRPLPMSRVRPLHAHADSGILITRHPEFQRDFYDIVLQWLEANFPALRQAFRVVDLPADDVAWDTITLHHAWLQDPVQMWSREAYTRATEIGAACDAMGIPIINRVERLTHASKSETARRLGSLGIRTPKIARITSAEEFRETFMGVPFPLFVRNDWGHAQQMLRADTPEEARAIDLSSFARPIAAEIIDVRDPRDGLYRKYRYFACGSHGVSHHLMVTAEWVSRGENRVLTDQTRDEELAYIAEQDPNHSVLQRAREALGLEFVAFDYGHDATGRMVVWEANPFPLIKWSTAALKYRNIALHRTILAMVRMYLDGAGIPYPDRLQRAVEGRPA